MDANLSLHLVSRDKSKKWKHKIQKTIKENKAKITRKYVNYNSAAADYLKSQKEGMCYKSGITVKEARKNLADTLKDRNPSGTKPEDGICIDYHTS